MKQYWQKMALRIDALSLRERGLIFAAIAAAIIMFVNTFILDPQFAKQKQLSDQVKGEQAQVNAIQSEIQSIMQASRATPETSDAARLQTLKQQSLKMQASLQDMQKGLVSPDKMTALLQDILQRNGHLQVVTLKTLPVVNLLEAAVDPKVAGEKAAATSSSVGSVYKHGVEITVQGNYLDMMKYMTELETMPWRLFWSKVGLNVDEYPKATLSLTLFTLSLDKKWLNL